MQMVRENMKKLILVTFPPKGHNSLAHFLIFWGLFWHITREEPTSSTLACIADPPPPHLRFFSLAWNRSDLHSSSFESQGIAISIHNCPRVKKSTYHDPFPSLFLLICIIEAFLTEDYKRWLEENSAFCRRRPSLSL